MKIPVLRAARELQEFLDESDWEFAFIGGLAVNRWGQPRTTNDADACVLTGFGQEHTYAEALLSRFPARIPNAVEFALQNRVLLLEGEGGFGIDVSLGGLPFEANAVERSSEFAFPDGVVLRTVGAEDLVTLKAFAARGQDWVDIENILIRQSATLDMNLIRQELTPLCELKEAPETIERLDQLWQACQEG